MTTIKLLLVEDDTVLADSVADVLCELGEIVHCSDGAEGLYEASTLQYDLIVLDIMLPSMDGYTVIQQLRSRDIQTPVLFLTAKDSLADKVEGFKKGADDYLTKPFYSEELVLRVQAMLKRSLGLSTAKTLTFGNTVCELTTRSVKVTEQELLLKGKAFDLLVYFIKQKKRIVTKEQIFERIWGFDSETSYSVVEVYMSNLRKKLTESKSDVMIRTLRNVGYILEEATDET